MPAMMLHRKHWTRSGRTADAAPAGLIHAFMGSPGTLPLTNNSWRVDGYTDARTVF
jgi:hypothetical protein